MGLSPGTVDGSRGAPAAVPVALAAHSLEQIGLGVVSVEAALLGQGLGTATTRAACNTSVNICCCSTGHRCPPPGFVTRLARVGKFSDGRAVDLDKLLNEDSHYFGGVFF